MTSIIRDNKQKLTELCEKFSVAELDVFGSVAGDDFDAETSDLDFLVEFDNSVKNRFDNFFSLQQALTKLFGRAVDLVEPGGLKTPYSIKQVNKTKRCVYVAS